MKSAKTMLAQARQCAIEKGIRVITDTQGRTIIGYAFTQAEISELYKLDGFTMKTMRNHISVWTELKLVIPVGKIWYIRLNGNEKEALEDLNEEKRMRQIHGDLDCYYISEAMA